jgi:two-component system cell cycle sensor histidine kinase/response regulator CckA
MTRDLRILILEDRAPDAELMMRELRREAISFAATRVWTQPDFVAELRDHPPDLVLADYALPSYDGLSALTVVRGERPDIPFILVSGSLGEDQAVDALHQGATDYVMKSRMGRLGPAVRRALREAELAAERLHMDSALRESEQRFRAMEQTAVDAIIVADDTGTIVGWNPAAHRMFGYTESEACGQPLTLVIPPLSQSSHLIGMDSIRSGGAPRILGTVTELVGLRRDGSEFPLELSLSGWETSEGRHFTGIVRDISERKAAEKQRQTMAVELRQAQKMEAVGRLAGGVAHDFNNMLAVISGYTDLALMNLDRSDPTYPDIQEVAKAARRSADLVRQLLAFARQQTIAPRALDLNEAIASLLKMLHRLIGEDVALTWTPGVGLGAVVMDPAQVDQILANLMVNARDAINGVGAVSIETSAAEIDQECRVTHPGLAPGKYVLLAVSDNGCGMDRETLAHIFEPFFTTKAQGQGTGLGLSTVYGIVKQNAGFIDVVSEPGRGTTFRIYLPMHAVLSVAADQPHTSADEPTYSETVLLVEDEAALLGLGLRTLRELGYTVLSSNSPNQAIDLVKDYSGTIDLLVTDVVMPEMNGRQLQQRLIALRPDLKCLFTSGYTADVLAHRGVLDDGVSFLAKPYSAKALAEKVRGVIAAA